MWRYKILLLILLIMTLLPAIPVIADSSADVTITATGIVITGEPGAPSGFVVYYINDYTVGLSWTNDPYTVNTMIRAKYGSPPSSLTDGYQVYYGGGQTANDTAVDFDQYAGQVYYRAWSENSSGGWSPLYSQGNVEGTIMGFLGILAIAGILTFAALWVNNLLLAGVAAAGWIGVFTYITNTPPGGLVQGSTAHEALLVATLFAAAGVFFSVPLRHSHDAPEEDEFGNKITGFRWSKFLSTGNTGRTTQRRSETVDEYRLRIHRALHPNPTRRRR